MNWEDYGSENKDHVLETEQMIRRDEVASRVAQDQARRRKRERLVFGLTALLSTAVVVGVAFSNIGNSESTVSTTLRQSVSSENVLLNEESPVIMENEYSTVELPPVEITPEDDQGYATEKVEEIVEALGEVTPTVEEIDHENTNENDDVVQVLVVQDAGKPVDDIEDATESADESEVTVEVIDTTTGAVLDKISNAVEVSSEIIGDIIAQKQVIIEVEDDATGEVEEERSGVVLIVKDSEGDLEEEVVDKSTGKVIEEGTTKNVNEVVEEVTKDAIDLIVPGLPIPDGADESITISQDEIQYSEEETHGVSENPALTESHNDEEEVLHIRPVHGDGELAVDLPGESVSVINEPEIIESSEVGPESEHHDEGEVNSDTAGEDKNEIEPSVNESDDKDKEPVDVQDSVVAAEDVVPVESGAATSAETVTKESAVDVVATADGDAYDAGEDIEPEQIGDVETEITGDDDAPALKKYLIESRLQNPNDFVLSDDTDDHQLVDAAAINDADGYYPLGMYHIMNDFVESDEISYDVGTSDTEKEEGDSIPDGTTGVEKGEDTDKASLTSESTFEVENEVPEKVPDTVETENDSTAVVGNKDTEENSPKVDENSAVAVEKEISAPHEHSEPNVEVVDNAEAVIGWAVEDKHGAIVDVVETETEAVEEVAENKGEIIVEVVDEPDTDPAIISQEETEEHPTESNEESEHSFEVVNTEKDDEVDQTPEVPDEPVANGKGGAVDEVAVDNYVVDAEEVAEDDEKDVVEEEGHDEVTGNVVGILDQEETGPGEDEEGDKHTDEVDTTDTEHVQGIAIGEFYPTHSINEAEGGEDAKHGETEKQSEPTHEADLQDGEEKSELSDNENGATRRALRA